MIETYKKRSSPGMKSRAMFDSHDTIVGVVKSNRDEPRGLNV